MWKSRLHLPGDFFWLLKNLWISVNGDDAIQLLSDLCPGTNQSKFYPKLKLTAKAPGKNWPFTPKRKQNKSSSNHPFSGANLLLLSGRRKNSQHSSRPPPPQGCNQTLQERRTSTLVLVGVGSCVSPKLSTWQLGAMCKSCHLMMVFHAFDFRDLVKIANKITGCSLIISFFAVTSNSSTDSTCFILSTSTSRPKTAAGPATRILPAAAVLWEHPQ